MFINCFIILYIPLVFAYTNNLFTLISYYPNISESQCGIPNPPSVKNTKDNLGKVDYPKITVTTSEADYDFRTISTTIFKENDPLQAFEKMMLQSLFGTKKDLGFDTNPKNKKELLKQVLKGTDIYAQVSVGSIMRAETFQNKSGVHLPMVEYMHRGHCYLNITDDHMQTAVDAFAILLVGTIEDVLRLPHVYVLRSARAISMMKIEYEKLAATWLVVKGLRKPEEVSYAELEQFRPLFKYLNGREMARLNLTDERILSLIGTHSDLNRHQVGVVASRYIVINPKWTEARYLNIMNNLLCGVPMTFMRRIPENTYLQLTHQLFYHISACDPLQRRFYLAMMTRTQALGKSYSWNAGDVFRLGLLLSEVEGHDLATINPESMAGITAQVMLEMPASKLTYITEMQLRYLKPKPLNILARKLTAYKNLLKELRGNAQKSSLPNILIYTIYMAILAITIQFMYWMCFISSQMIKFERIQRW